MRFLSFLPLVFLFASSGTAQELAPQPAPKPKLVVVISVDQFSADLFAQYRNRFTGGFARLLDGAVFPSGYQSHSATETCPGHSTIMTGDHPARTGIIANEWYDFAGARPGLAYCMEDERQGTYKDYVASDVHLRVPTLGERLKDADPAVRPVSVAGKDRAPIPPRGALSTSQAQRLPSPPGANRSIARSSPTAAPSALGSSSGPPRPKRRGKHRLLSTARSSTLRPAWSATCGLAVAPRPTSSRSARRRPIMSGTPTARRGRRCASSSPISTAPWASSSRCSMRRGSIMSSR